jgi:hypothetical protein
MASAASFPRTPDGEQLLVYPWIAPDERIDVLNEMAEADAHTPGVRAVVSRALATLPPFPSDRAVLQRLLDAVFETVVYRPDPASDQDFYQPSLLTLRPVPGNPISPLTGKPKGAGDCEDSSVLFAAFVHAAAALTGRRFGTHVEWLSQPGKPQNHVPATAWGADGERLWAETTLPGARIGEHPYAALARLGNAERVEGTYVPTNSSGAPAVTVVEVAVLDDGTRVMADAARVASGRPFSAWAYPASGFPYPVTLPDPPQL